MITITLLILFDRNKYDNSIYPALSELKTGNISKVEKLTKKIDKSIVVDFWDFSDIPEDDNEFSGFFDDFILALEQEIINTNKLPENIDKHSLRKMIVDMVKGSKNKDVILPDEIIKRITGINNWPVTGEIDTNFNNEEQETFDEHLNATKEEEQPDKEEELGILEHEMEDIIEEVKKNKKADPDTIMYFKARLIEAFCIPVNKVSYRYDLTGNLVNVFLYSLSDKIFDLIKTKKKCEHLLPLLEKEHEEITEDIFDRLIGQNNISEFMTTIEGLEKQYNNNQAFEYIDQILQKNIKGEWWNKMNEAEKRIRINNWWNEIELLKKFLLGASDHGYDILISTI